LRSAWTQASCAACSPASPSRTRPSAHPRHSPSATAHWPPASQGGDQAHQARRLCAAPAAAGHAWRGERRGPAAPSAAGGRPPVSGDLRAGRRRGGDARRAADRRAAAAQRGGRDGGAGLCLGPRRALLAGGVAAAGRAALGRGAQPASGGPKPGPGHNAGECARRFAFCRSRCSASICFLLV
jgi:hypothetical protein